MKRLVSILIAMLTFCMLTLEGNAKVYAGTCQNSECFHCKHLPYCMGPCPFKRDEMLGKFGKIVCQYTDADQAIERSIIRYCENSSDINH